jgi:outer membrane biosynthesis protein TonB
VSHKETARRSAALASACALLLSLPLLAADPPAATPPGQEAQKPPQGGAGGDGGDKPGSASMVIEETSTSAEPEPPAPQGEERTQIGEYVRSHTDDVRDCYAKRLQERPTLQGKLIARFDIGPNGKVIGATADGIGDSGLVACVVAVVRKWEFEKPVSGGKLRIKFPFVLKPESAGK